MFDSPEQRAIALARISVLRNLADDLAAIVNGSKPTPKKSLRLFPFEASSGSVRCPV
ncbi:hypothetical protein [Bosea sp. F3-2]|uniref:hypothetical protein n=1 Tax=Bosea sp. F3-2 TaxID=2599640 RepID=UPI001655B0B2|nr:hypothetical protein [Bosea sp. F3-2]